jgi:hypothetical protein
MDAPLAVSKYNLPATTFFIGSNALVRQVPAMWQGERPLKASQRPWGGIRSILYIL